MEPDKNDRLPDVSDVVWDAIEKDGRVAWYDGPTGRYLYRPDQLLVDLAFEPELAEGLERVGARRQRCHSREGRILERLGLRRYRLIRRIDAKEALDKVRESVAGNDEAAAAVTLTHVLVGTPTYKFGPGDLPQDGGPDRVEPEPSKRSGTGKGVRVSILDTGFVGSSVQRHPLLAQGYADDGDDLDTLYDNANKKIQSVFGGHGTFIAGIVRQLAPDTELNPEVTLDSGITDEVELALDLLRERPAHIVNLSLGGPSEDDRAPQALTKAFNLLREHSAAVFVAAAGNDYQQATKAGAPERPTWPAGFGGIEGFEHVVSVAAVQDGERGIEPAPFTNRGPWVRASAYGVDVRSTYVEGQLPVSPGVLAFPNATATWSGTSFATPRVAGIIAATMTASDPPLSPRDALAEVLANASPGPAGCGVFVD